MIDFLIKNGILTSYKGNDSHIVIPNNVEKIGSLAFYGRRGTNIKSINIPNSVKEIYFQAFDGCKSLKSIEIPNSVTRIGSDAFNGCKNLSNIKIPNSVTYIGFGPFRGIKKVKPQYNNGKLRAFKAFYYDWTCINDFHYDIGKSYHQNGKIICCENGFHACMNPLHVFNYYWGDLNPLHFAEVELSGTMDWADNKVAASDIKIIRELTISELSEIYNAMEKE